MTVNVDMPNFMPNFMLAAPEIVVLTMACILLVMDLFIEQRHRVLSYVFAQITLLAAAAMTLYGFGGERVVTFSGTFVADGMGDVLKLFVYLVTAFVFLYSRSYLDARNIFKGEYYVLGLFGVLGMMVMISAHNFLSVYLGLELLSLSLYAMVAFQRDSLQASEAAMKYFVLGAIASGMLLYGMSMLYGVTGSLDIAEVAAVLGKQQGLMLNFALVFIIIGVAFKLGAVPFHMWVPDVYHGAPTAVTMYIGSAPKIAAFALVMRLLVEGMPSLHGEWMDILIVLSVLSLAVGNIFAIAQSNIKRMLAYSTISHVGFLLLGVLAGTRDGYAASMFYAIVYAITAAGAFGMIIIMSRAGFEADNLSDYKGLNQRHPWLAAMMALFMFSMAGVPPTVGFFAKLYVIKAVVDVNLVWLAAVAVGFSVIGAFYYLRMIKLLYFDAPEDEHELAPSTDVKLAMSVNGLAMLALGVLPGGLIGLCAAVLQ